MSEQNPEIVRAAIDAYNRGDWDAAFKDAAPGFEWDNSRAIGADRRDGIEARARTTWLFTIRNSQIERVCLCQDKHEALGAAGLSE